MATPMVITLYGEGNEIIKTYTRSFVPWKLLKAAIRLTKEVNLDKLEDMSEEDADKIAGLVVAVFGDQFTVKELDDHASLPEMIAVLQQIIATASGGISKNTVPPA